jgi:hypothetical protein
MFCKIIVIENLIHLMRKIIELAASISAVDWWRVATITGS